jgi:citrate lyase subunit beta/citryl-CoA lyase
LGSFVIGRVVFYFGVVGLAAKPEQMTALPGGTAFNQMFSNATSRAASVAGASSFRDMREKWEAATAGSDTVDPDIAAKNVMAEAVASVQPTSLCPRSALFVPCSNMKALKKIASLSADVFILDLEDSVAPLDKEQARENLIDVLRGGELDGKTCYVRVNSIRTSAKHAFADLDTCGLAAKWIRGVALPKIEIGDDELVESYLHPEHKLWGFFETPSAICDARKICESGKYEAVVMGNNDLAAELQLPMVGGKGGPHAKFSSRYGLLNPMSQVVVAARAAGIHVIDGVYNDPTDGDGFRAECYEGKLLGFSGKSLIHPNQIAASHEMFSPSEAEIAWARAVVAAIDEAGGGVAVVEGKMVEELHATRAKAVLALARRADQSDSTKQQMEKLAPEPRRKMRRSSKSWIVRDEKWQELDDEKVVRAPEHLH